MLLETGDKVGVCSRLGHLGKRFNNLLLGAVKVFEFVNVQVFEGIEFHTSSFESGTFLGCIIPSACKFGIEK